MRRRTLATLALATALVAFPLGALASHDFADVPDSNPFHNDISALVDSGVTSGCGGGNYCPSANVTREQMAAFLNRLGALAPGKTPVVNAALLDGLDSTDFLQPGDIVTRQVTPWESTSAAIINHTGTYEQILLTSASSGSAQLGLLAPVSIGARVYGLLAVELCFIASADTDVDSWAVNEVTPAGTMVPVLFDADGFNPALLNGCVSMSLGAPDPAGNTYHLRINQTTASSGKGLKVTRVTTTWAPI